MSIALSAKKIVWAVLAVLATLFMGGCSAGNGEDIDSLSAPLCSGISIAASPASPQAVGAMVTITASGTTCGAGETPEFIFYYLTPGGTYVLFRNWATSPVATWNTTGLPSGAYQIYVQTRPVGGGSASSVYLPAKYSIGSTCGTTNTFTTSPAAPQPVGATVTLSSTATCSFSGTPEFRYAYQAPGSASFVYINAGYSSAPVAWNTTGLPAGNYTLLVQTRAVGNSSTNESSKYASYTLGSTNCTGAGVSASPTSPRPAGTSVTLTGTAACGGPEFSFWYRAFGGTTWILIRTFAATPAVWNTTGLASGTYEVLVGARAVGHPAADSFAQINYGIGSVCSAVTLGASPATPQPQGTTVTFTASATCNSGTAEYRYLYQRSTDPSPVEIRTWGPASVVWDTSALTATGYTITVLARAVGNTSNFDVGAALSYTLSAPRPTAISTGFGFHTCAVMNNGQARCWGENSKGELGTGSTSPSSSSPVRVSGLTGVLAVTTGFSHSCALISGGTVRCWGDGALGQLGNGGTSSSSTPVTVTGLSDATAISGGMNHTCALRTGGAVSCWGYNPQGQIGSAAAFPSATTPVAVAGITGATAIAVGGFHSCALVGGAVTCWGDNSLGQLGNGGTPSNTNTPVSVTGLSGVTSLSSGEQHSCAVVSGAVKCWGDNFYGQLGDGTKTQANVPVNVTGITTAAQVAAGFPFSCARLASGSVSCWGHNDEGELGNGTAVESLSPTAVTGISAATAISSGSLQSCVMLATTAQCWGYNGLGQLGNGTTTDAHTPVTVVFP